MASVSDTMTSSPQREVAAMQRPASALGDAVRGHRPEARNDDIEVLRAVAIGLVLVCHFVWQSLSSAGSWAAAIQPYFSFWSGVDLFFCVSGFVITSSLLASRRRDQDIQSYRAFVVPFYIRRAFRLLPSAWLWILLTLLGTVFLNRHGQFGYLRDNLRDAVAAVAEVYNFHAYWCSLAQDCGLMGHYWSLSLEEQFYLTLPLLLILVARLRVLVSILLIAFAAQFAMPRPEGFFVSHSLLWFTRTDAIILGVLIAIWREHGSSSYRLADPTWLRNRAAAAITLLVCVFLLILLPSPHLANLWCATGLLALVSAFLVQAASYNRHYILQPSRLKRASIWIGARSYSIYLVHIPIYHALKELSDYAIGQSSVRLLGPAYAAVFLLGCIVSTLFVAHWNFRFFETPFRNLGRDLACRYRDQLLRTRSSDPKVAA